MLSEHAIQAALVAAIDLLAQRQPGLRLLYAVPNGGHRHPATAARLRAEGVRPGVPDLCLPVPRGGYVGCYVELKTPRGRVQPHQQAWLDALAAEGHYVAVCRDVRAALDLLVAYEAGQIRRPAREDIHA